MNKRAIWLPFIFMYKTLFYIIKTPIVLLKYACIGTYFFVYLIYKYLLSNVLKGFHFIVYVLGIVVLTISSYFYRAIHKMINLIGKLFLYGCKGTYLLFHSIGKILSYLAKYVIKGCYLILCFIGKIFTYLCLGVYFIFKYTVIYLFLLIMSGIVLLCKYFYLGLHTFFGLIFNPLKKSMEANKIKKEKIKIKQEKYAMASKKANVPIKKITNNKKKKKKKNKYNTSKYKEPKISYIKMQPKIKKKYQPKVFLFVSTRLYLFFKYVFLGIAYVLYLLYRFVRYAFLGVLLPLNVIFNFISGPLQNFIIKQMRVSKIKQEEKAVQKFLEKKELDKMRFEQIKIREERNRQKERDKRDRSVVFAKVEKETFETKIKRWLDAINKIPERIKQRLKEEARFSPLAQAFAAESKMPDRPMVIDYEGIDAIKSKDKLLYEYIVRDPNTGKVIKGHFDAFSIVEVHSFLISEGYEVYSIKTSPIMRILNMHSSSSHRKIKISDLIFMLTQLSTYIKAGLPLVEALKILAKQYQKSKYSLIFKTIIYDLKMGENFSIALTKQGDAFPRLLINMIKTAEMTGELPEALDDMVEYYTETEQTRKQMVSALTYPTIVLIMAVGVLSFIMVYVVPKFVDIYKTMDNASIPAFTVFITKVSAFMQDNIIYLGIGFVALIILLRFLYTNVKFFRYLFQWLGMHFPVMGNIMIYNEVTMFTKTFSSLLSHNVFITDSMDILNRVTSNEIYKVLIAKTIENLNRGERISLSFENSWAFPIPAYEMLVTGEKTGQLPEMMGKVSDYYQELHRNSVSRLKALIEPVLIIFLTAIVGVIIMAVIIPMFNMYSSIGSYGNY